jgi:hypothetical protein
MSYISNREFLIEVAKGNIANHSFQRIIARNSDVDTAEEDIWFTGGELTYLTSAERMNIVSSSANDTSAGTGARTVLITGLDNDYNEISETVTMTGTSNVLTTNSYLRIHICQVATAGTGGKTAGNITATAQTAGTVHVTIPAGENRSGKSQFTIPAGKTGYLIDFMPSLASGKTGCDVTFKARPIGEVFRMVSRIGLNTSGASAVNHIITMGPPQFLEKTDLKVSAQGSANDQDVFCEYILLLINN